MLFWNWPIYKFKVIYLTIHQRDPVDEHKIKHGVLREHVIIIYAFIFRVSTRSLRISLLRPFWFKINRIRSGVERICLSMRKIFPSIIASGAPLDRLLTSSSHHSLLINCVLTVPHTLDIPGNVWS